jgi:hypothetical protein
MSRVAPLRKIHADGSPYQRRLEIEAALGDLVLLRRSETAERCKIIDPGNADHLPSECLLNLVRASRSDNSDVHFTVLFRALRQRVLARLPRSDVGRGPDGKILDSQTNIRIGEAVMDRFQELLMLDRCGYEDRLDYFEINFDDAVASLRLTARKKAWKDENRSEPMTYDDETSELNAEIEEAAAAQNPLSESKLDDPGYRLRLNAAIDALPEHQRRVVELLRQGFSIDSKEAGVQTIVGTLGCAEKTVRNRRDKAYEAIRKALEEEES